MLVLFETPAGYAIFKLLNEAKLEQSENLYRDFETPEKASKLLKLKHFERFTDTTQALLAATSAAEGKVSKTLKGVLKKFVAKGPDQILVGDTKLGAAIKEKFQVPCLANSAVQELMRCIRSQLEGLVSGLTKKDLTAMTLGLAHSLSRYKLKFSPDKVDIMVVHAVCLLDDLDKELNNYIMRCREWYGWHFPELGKIVADNIAYVKTVKAIGDRETTASKDLSDILPEELEEKVKEAAEISIGTELAEEDIMNIHYLCDQIISISDYRAQLYDFLKARMMALAPNLTVLLGELVGARLISSSGSLLNLAKQPGSTIQILGAEKALFRALKTKKDTPKFGLIYHTQLLGQCSTKNRGKMARMLASKAALAVRVDALGEDTNIDLGAEHKAKLEGRLRILEEGNIKRLSGTARAKAKFQKYQGGGEIHQYQPAADSVMPSTSKRKRSESETVEEVQDAETETPKQKKKKLKKEVKEEVEEEAVSETPKDKKKKIKKEVKEEVEEEETVSESPKAKKKKIKKEAKEEVEEETVFETPKDKKKKKKTMNSE